MQRRLQRLLQSEDPSKLPAQIMKDQYNQYVYQKRSIPHQKDVKKLLMDFYYHNYKYIQREWFIRKSQICPTKQKVNHQNSEKITGLR